MWLRWRDPAPLRETWRRKKLLPTQRRTSAASSVSARSKITALRCRGRVAIALLTAKEIFDLVRDDLAQVEQEIARQNGSAIEPVAEIRSEEHTSEIQSRPHPVYRLLL